MVSPSSRLVNLMTAVLGGRAATRCQDGVRRRIADLADRADADIEQECRTLLSSPKLVTSASPNRVGSIGRLGGYELTPADERALATAATAFTRFPPGTIPRGTRLFDQQIEAAIQLVRGALVQMDTGEGKTYAIMIAAFALLRRSPKVYVLTANPYLALRDAGDTVRFWSRIGIRVGVAPPDRYRVDGWPGWDADVVYSTAETFAIQSLRDDAATTTAHRRISRTAAVILDEADAILLEQVSQRFQLTRDVSVTTKDWDTACAVARELDERHVTVTESLHLAVILTAAGEAEVRRLQGEQHNDLERLSLLHDVELAYTALRLAVPGLHYEHSAGGPVALEPTSGWRTPARPAWLEPLAHDVGAGQAMRTQIVGLGDGLGLLSAVPHLCGTSGTVIDEALEYILLLGMPAVAVSPRRPRFDAQVKDVFCVDEGALSRHLLSNVRRFAERQPMMIVSSSTREAKSVADFLAAHAPPGVEVRFASGERITEERLFEDAGRPGVVIVSTRVAGRGVDVRLSDEARANGGMVLISIGHALDGRLDRQLLGRVGRQGDRFTAWFANHPNDMLTREVGNTAIAKAVMASTGVTEFESGFYRRALESAQRLRRRLRLQDFASGVVRSAANHGAYAVLGEWRRLMQAGGTNTALSEEFIAALAGRYVASQFPGIDGRLTEVQAELVEQRLLSVGCAPATERSLRSRLVGQQVVEGMALATAVLTDNLRAAVETNAVAIREARAKRVRRAEQELDLGVLRELRGRIDESGAFCTDHRAALVHDGALPDERHPPASAATRRSRIRLRSLRLRTGNGDTDRLMSMMNREDPWLLTDDALRAVTKAVEQLDDLPTWTRLDRLVERLRWAEEARLTAIDVVVPDHTARTAKNVVLETVSAAADLLDRARERALFALNQRQISPLRYQNNYVAMCDDLRRQIESHLIESLCRNLITAADPDRLGVLFQQAESTVPPTAYPTTKLVWSGQKQVIEEPVIVAPKGATADELIEMFLRALDQHQVGRRGRGTSRAEVLPAISATLADSPLSTLADPLRVREALERWRSHRLRAELLPWRRRVVDRHVRDFLGFLNDQGIAARLPTGPLAVSRAWFARATRRLKSPQAAIGVAALILVAGIAPLLAIDMGLSTSDPGLVLGLVDQLFSGGLLGGGLVLGAGLLTITGAALVTWLLSNENAARGVLPIERLLSLLLAVSGAAVLAGPWWGRSFSGTLNGLLVALAVLAVTLTFRKLMWTAEQLTQIRLAAGLFSCLTVLTLLWIGRHSAPWPGYLLGIAATAVTLIVLTRVRRARLPVNALRQSRANEPVIVPTTRTITTQVSWRIYGYALGSAWLVRYALPAGVRDTWIADGGLMLLYLGVVVVWARVLGTSTADPETWQRILRRAGQSYRDSTERPTLEQGLSTLRRRLLAGEMLAGLAAVTFALVFQLMADDRVRAAFPVGLTVVTLMIMAYELSRQFLSSVNSIFFGVASPSAAAAADDLSGSITADARDMLHRLRKRLVVVLAVVVVLSKAAEILDIWEVVQAIAKWFADLF